VTVERERRALREELERLEREERELSALRSKLHERIDRGFTNDSTRTQERQVSDRRREVHAQIDRVRAALDELD
jgi:hypothetical protein